MICRQTTDDSGALTYSCRQEGLLFYAHRSFEPGKPGALIVLAVESFFIFVFWTCTALMREDFSKAFAAITMAPLTCRAAVLLFHSAIIHVMDFPDIKV
ncbi:hypothetical protein GCK32_021826 [Trichostrongylus colubriformis]|uniref:Uncharacterized protein n=1 Tax=Trichostrongylus colubriformis TaxID=6319 RepID=A0AAN8G450_TRICO